MASKTASKARPATRHVISINDLSDKDIETIFDIAQSYLKQLPDPHFPYRIGRSTNVASNFILASLFYEPSTRTRLSFESAMIRLGGQTITSADPATSSAAKGESLADTVRVIANYADIMVIRHPRDGAARLAAEYSPIPVINGGDGSHEHPTQTLCDLFTLKQKNKRLKNLKVAISGDLQGLAHHPFLRLCAGALRRDHHADAGQGHGAARPCRSAAARGIPLPHGAGAKGEGDDASIDALYVTPEEPHQQSLFSGPEIESDIGRDRMVEKKVDAVYVTRFQKERWAEKDQAYPRIDRKFLNEPKYSDASVMHPLPRVGELDAAFDTDRRAVYFEQAAYGVPVRMALIALLLGLKGKSLHRFEGGFERERISGLRPAAQHRPALRQPELHRARADGSAIRAQQVLRREDAAQQARLRCVYCEREIEHFVVASKKNKWYAADPAALVRGDRPGSQGHRRCSPTKPTRRRPASIRDAPPPSRQPRATRRRRSKVSVAADAMLDALDWSLLAVSAVALLFGYLLGSIPFGVILTRLAGAQDIRSDRLRQYRRHQCAAHRPQGAGRGDAARRHAQGHGRGAGRRWRSSSRDLAHASPARRLHRPPLSGLAADSRAAKASRPISASCLALAWPVGARLLRRSGSRSRRSPATRRSSALIASAATPAVLWRQRRGLEPVLFRRADGHAVDQASRQHRAAAQRHRRQDRPEGQGSAEQLKPPFRRRPRIVGAHHVVLHRNADMERHQRQQAERQIGVER